MGCGLAAAGLAQVGWAQSGADGAIGGRVLSASGAPLAGAVVAVREAETGLEQSARSGRHGEFLVPRLPVGEYTVTVESTGAELALPESVRVGLGEVTEIEARMGAASARMGAGGGRDVAGSELAVLPVDGGAWRSVALAMAGANGAAEKDDDAGAASFRGVDLAQNSTRLDGASEDESFSGGPAGAGVAEDTDAGSDEVHDAAAGVGSGPRSVTDGGQRAGSSYAFAAGAVREFRVDGQGSAAQYGSALYGHGVGGVVTSVSRSGGSTLHGMVFYTVRDSAWAAVDPFALAQTYNNGAMTSALVRPEDLLQQFGGSVGGPLWEKDANPSNHGSTRINADQNQGIEAVSQRARAGPDTALGAGAGARLFYFYAFDAERRNFPAISSPGYAGFYALTATQRALLANRGVTPAATNAALNYMASLTGTVARRADQTVNFARLDWQRQQQQCAPRGARVEPRALERAGRGAVGRGGGPRGGQRGIDFMAMPGDAGVARAGSSFRAAG